MRPLILASVLAAIPLCFVQCGGTAIIDGLGAGGQGGASSSGSSTDTGSGAGNPTSSGTGINPNTACDQLCDGAAALGCGVGPDCADECVDGLSSECGDVFAELVACLAEEIEGLTNCNQLDAVCPQQQAAWESCQGGCETGECSVGSDGTCKCVAFCEDLTIESFCEPTGQGDVVCTCIYNGDAVFECLDDPANACDPFQGCCSEGF